MKIKEIKTAFKKPDKGSLLVSEPFLTDMNFWRSVILLTEQTPQGTIGFILNKPAHLSTEEAIPGMLDVEFPVYYGGPMEPNSLHFIHKHGALIPGCFEVLPNVFWGGDIHVINELLKNGTATANDFKFFLGYSGWEIGQIEDEMNEKAWWVTLGNEELIFDTDLDNMWAKVVKQLGEDFSYMANSPEDVSWN